MAVYIKILVFWDVTLCSLLGSLVHILVPIYPTRQQLLGDLNPYPTNVENRVSS